MSAVHEKRWTAEDYLSFERASDQKHEFIDGTIYAMTGASESHNLIVLNIGTSLNIQLRKHPCRVYVNDMRVRVDQSRYVYPDVAAVCGQTQFEDAEVDTLLNPTLIVEVLSPSTEQHDRITKFALYRAVPTLQEYVLVAQDRPQVERYLRQPEGTWLFSEHGGLEATLELPSLGCTLALADLYDKVAFPDEADASTES